MTQRKLWVGVSSVEDHSPCDFVTFIVMCDEDIDNSLETAMDFAKNDLADAEEMEDEGNGEIQ